MSLTFILPDQLESFTNFFMLSLAIYREARGESIAAKLAVGWAIRNRVHHAGWFGKTYFEVVTKRAQFSSFNLGEPNSIIFGSPDDVAWQESVQAATGIMQSTRLDPTAGSTFYYDKSMDSDPPIWAKDYTHTVDIGNFHFFRQSVNAC